MDSSSSSRTSCSAPSKPKPKRCVVRLFLANSSEKTKESFVSARLFDGVDENLTPTLLYSRSRMQTRPCCGISSRSSKMSSRGRRCGWLPPFVTDVTWCLTFPVLYPQAKAAEAEATYRREQQTMLAAWHDLGLKTMRERVVSAAASSPSNKQQQRPYQPQSWLSQQRARVNGKGLVEFRVSEPLEGAMNSER